MEIQALGERVVRDRLTTLVGPGGIGKTRLAGVVASGRQESFPDGVWWVDLAAVSTVERVPQAVAQASGTPLGDGDGPVLLARALAGRRLLLVLDNCEHVLAGVTAVLVPLLAATAGVNVLATSQVRLEVTGEQVWRLDALEVPPGDASLDVARTFGAVRLFERRAQAADQKFALDAATTASVIDICRKLDGNALAIEMAAAWAPLVGLGVLKQRLVERLRLFSSGNRTLPSRQRSLRATLDWSHSLLGPTEQQVLRRLSVFVGSIRLELAQRVASGARRDRRVDGARGAADARRSIADPGRADAAAALSTARVGPAVRWGTACRGRRDPGGRAASRRGVRAPRGHPARRLSGAVAPRFLDLYAADHADMNAAFSRACERQDAATGAVTGAALIYLAAAFGVNTEMRRLQKAAYDLLPAATDPLDRALLWRQVAAASSIGSPTVPRLLAARESVEAWRVVGDVRGLYVALAALSAECARSADFEGARAAAAQARVIEDPSWLPRLRAIGLRLDLDIAVYSGDVQIGRESARAALRLAESTGDTRDVMGVRQGLAVLAAAAGDVDEAIALAREGIAFGRDVHRPSYVSESLLTLCNASVIAGDDRSAAQAALEALPIMRPNLWAPRLFDAVALLSARTGNAADARLAARFIGHADRWYAANQMPQRAAAEGHVLALALAAIDAAIGTEERRMGREEGAAMSDAQADELAVALLERVRRSAG